VRRGELRRILPDWCMSSHTAWAVFPGRRLMPAKTRAFIDMLETALAGADANSSGMLANERPGRA
jgi:DNA-binding transcriptional LysR family regulator